MDKESIAALKFDVRMARRREWVDPEELEQELASLPDCADKIQEPTDDSAAPAAADSSPSPDSAPPTYGSEGGTPGA